MQQQTERLPNGMRGKIRSYLCGWKAKGYTDGIPDAADARLEELCKAPSYRAICKAILQNDMALVSLGFSREKTPEYMALKRVELDERIRRKQGTD